MEKYWNRTKIEKRRGKWTKSRKKCYFALRLSQQILRHKLVSLGSEKGDFWCIQFQKRGPKNALQLALVSKNSEIQKKNQIPPGYWTENYIGTPSNDRKLPNHNPKLWA